MSIAHPALQPEISDLPTSTRYRHAAACVIAATFAIRIIYMLWLSPWELVGDEAYYWEWTRHLDLCYYEKGPALAYLLWPFVKIFGVNEFALRLPMAILSAITAIMLVRLATHIAQDRAGLLAAILFCITPAFFANAQLCTQDGPIILIWTALSVTGLTLVRNWESNSDTLRNWLFFGLWLGIGFLFKQSILLFASSLITYAFIRRKHLRWNPALFLKISACVFLAAAFSLPMLIWNARHGWPTLAHTLGHLGAGGDHEIDEKSVYSPFKWFFTLLGTQIGAFGPGLLFMMILSILAAFRNRKSDQSLWLARLWLICCALPSLAFFTLLSLRKEVLGNWPFPCFVTLIVLAADWAARQWPLSWKSAPARFAIPWKLSIIYGVIGCLVIAFPTWLAILPVAKKGEQSPLARMTGHRRHAREIQQSRELARAQTGVDPILITRYYMVSALDAFYLDDHPTVFCAGTAFGKRPTAYDYWRDTDLTQPSLIGRPAILDRLVSRSWGDTLLFDQVQELNDFSFLGINFKGLRKAPRK